MFVYLKYEFAERLLSTRVAAHNRNIVVNPKVHVPEQYLAALPAVGKKLGRRFCLPQHTVSPVSKINDTPPPGSTTHSKWPYRNHSPGVKCQFPDHQNVKSLQIIPEIEDTSTRG